MTGESLEERLAAAAAAVRDHELADARRKHLEWTAETLRPLIERLWADAAVEARDVARLEGLSLTRFVAALRGDRDDALARERAELEAVRYRAIAAEDRLAAVEQELVAVAHRLKRLRGVHGRLTRLLLEKETLIGTAQPALAALATERGRIETELAEVKQAQTAAEGARQALERLALSLDEAGSWSTYDTFFGGGPLAGMNKRELLDRATADAVTADRFLSALRTELADVPHAGEAVLGLDGSGWFIDVWFDDFFTDWSRHQEIRAAEGRVAACRDRLTIIRRALDQRAESSRKRLAEIAAERQALLLS